MTALEIIMLVIGIVCFVFSFIVSGDDSDKDYDDESLDYEPELTNDQIAKISRQIDDIVSDRISQAEDIAEASLDKISNTKIMEMNEYAESVINEINKNHNETVFMYDMLNDKSKEIKTIIKDINSVKADIEISRASMEDHKAQLEALVVDSAEIVKEMGVAVRVANKSRTAALPVAEVREQLAKTQTNTVPIPPLKNENMEVVDDPSDIFHMNTVENTSNAMNCNEEILSLHKQGKSNLEIAKMLNLGMGEVKLVIDLFNKSR